MDRWTREAAQRWLAEGVPAVVVCVEDAKGSTPREAGARMLVSVEEAVGTIGGGHLELKAMETARALLAARSTTTKTEPYALGPSLGQCCGGAVSLRFEPLSDEALRQWPRSQPLFHLQMYGAGHVGRAIAQILATLDVEVDWIDEREDAFPPTMLYGAPWPMHIRRVCVDAVEAEVDRAPGDAYFLVLTHSHELDMRITEAILRRGRFGYLGLIGSKSKRERFLRRFQERGILSEVFDRMECPIGLRTIHSKEAGAIAVGVVSRLLVADR